MNLFYTQFVSLSVCLSRYIVSLLHSVFSLKLPFSCCDKIDFNDPKRAIFQSGFTALESNDHFHFHRTNKKLDNSSEILQSCFLLCVRPVRAYLFSCCDVFVSLIYRQYTQSTRNTHTHNHIALISNYFHHTHQFFLSAMATFTILQTAE